jgi:hypothetical protein
MTRTNARTHATTETEAGAWADVLVRYGLLHAALRTPNGQWLIQHRFDDPVCVLDGPSAVIELAARIQHRARHETRNR